MNRFAETPVGALVVERPSRARVFEQYSIDYCCGGKVTLSEACGTRSLPLAPIVEALERLELSPVEPALPEDPLLLIEHIVSTHHAYLRGEFGRVSGLAEKVKQAHGAKHPELADVVATYEAVRADLEPHLMKEERVLFPWIEELVRSGGAALGRPSVGAPISMMEHEHVAVGELLARLRELTGAYTPPPDACPTFHAFYSALQELEQDTHTHIHKENNLLFPLAIGLEG